MAGAKEIEKTTGYKYSADTIKKLALSEALERYAEEMNVEQTGKGLGFKTPAPKKKLPFTVPDSEFTNL